MSLCILSFMRTIGFVTLKELEPALKENQINGHTLI